MAETVKKFLDYEGLQYLLGKMLSGDINGKGLSTNDFTDEMLTKLNGTATTEGLADLTTRLQTLEGHFGTDSDKVINKFQEIVAFLAGIESTETLDGLLSGVATQIADAKKAGTDAAAALNTYKGTNDTAVAAAKKAGTDAATALNTYKAANDAAVADAKKAGTDAATALNTYKTANDAAVAEKVDKVDGKGLSTNDYTTAEKSLVATISNKLNASDITSITTAEINALISA